MHVEACRTRFPAVRDGPLKWFALGRTSPCACRSGGSFVAHAGAEVRGFDVMGHIQRVAVHLLIDIVERRKHVAHRCGCGSGCRDAPVPRWWSSCPRRGNYACILKTTLGQILRGQTRFKGKCAAIQDNSSFGSRYCVPVGGIEAAGAVIPGAKVSEIEPDVSEIFALQTEDKFVVVLVEQRVSVQGKRGALATSFCRCRSLMPPKGSLLNLYHSCACAVLPDVNRPPTPSSTNCY